MVIRLYNVYCFVYCLLLCLLCIALFSVYCFIMLVCWRQRWRVDRHVESAFVFFRAMRKMPYLHDGSAVEILPWDIAPCTLFRLSFCLRPYSNTGKIILQIFKISFGSNLFISV
jgi:hypothetical protein